MSKVHDLVAMAHGADLRRTIEFYAKLGFERGDVLECDGRINWVWLYRENARIMFSRAEAQVVPEQQAVLFYLYTRDVKALHAELKAQGVPVSGITHPVYMPKGEFCVSDPDGYTLLIGQGA